jgi:hypothetical protein
MAFPESVYTAAEAYKTGRGRCGIWLWIELNANGTGDYQGADCGHGLVWVRDSGEVTWPRERIQLVICGVVSTRSPDSGHRHGVGQLRGGTPAPSAP